MAGTHDHSDVGRVPFWVHQLVELLLGILLLVQGARTGEHTVVLVTLGGLLLLLALCSDGALGAWPWIGRRVHRVLDLVVAAALALSPVVLGLDSVLAIVILEATAVAMLWLAFRTEWRSAATRKAAALPASAASPTPPAPAAPTAATPSPPSPAPPSAPRSSTPSTPLARKAGSAVGKARDDGPRQLGRLVGRAQRAAKAAMAPSPDPQGPPPTPEGPPEPPDAEPPG